MAINWEEACKQAYKQLHETEMELFEVKYQNRIDTLIRETGNYLTTLEACEILEEEDRKKREADPAYQERETLSRALLEGGLE